MADKNTSKDKINAISVKVNEVLEDLEWNARKEYQGIDDLAKSIKRNGQYTPIIISPIKDQGQYKYHLTAGYRRFAAVKNILKWEEIDAVVRVVKDAAEAFTINVTENLARDQLTTFEIANAVKRFHDDYGLTTRQISTKLSGGRSIGQKHCDNYLRALNNLHPKIIEAWKLGSPECTTTKLFAWAAQEQEEQLKLWEIEKGLYPKPPKIPTGSEDNGPDTPPKRPSPSKLKKCLQALKDQDEKSPQLDGAIAAVRWALAETKTLRLEDYGVVFDPEKKPPKETE